MEQLPAGPLQQAADEQLWGWSHLWEWSWQLLPWYRRAERYIASFCRKGEKCTLLPLWSGNLKEFHRKKNKNKITSSFLDQKNGPDSARRCRWHPGHGGGQCWVSLLCCAETPWPWYFCLVLCTLKLSSDFCGRTWTWESDNMVSLENAVAFLLVLSFPGLPKAMQAAHRYLLVLKWS